MKIELNIMGNYTVKGHHAVMKQTAEQDYQITKNLCQQLCQKPIEPKGKSWQKIEDATAAMVKLIPNEAHLLKLNRGFSYYISLSILISLLFVGCGEKKEPSIYITNIGIRIVPDSVTTLTNLPDTIYFNPIINHSEIK